MRDNDKLIALLDGSKSKEEHTMHRKNRIFVEGFLTVICVLLLTACASRTQSAGTAWGVGVFNSNGERIYFTATSERGTPITYTGGPTSREWMMMGGQLACVSCHGPGGQGGKHSMGMMQVMDAKDIRWSVLEGEFDAENFRLAVVNGEDPDGTQLNSDMPRWNISDNDLADLIVFLKTLP
jgi:cytochrome c oxidase subunit 2